MLLSPCDHLTHCATDRRIWWALVVSQRGRSRAIRIVVADRFAVNAGVRVRIPDEQDRSDDWRSLPVRSADATQKSTSGVFSGAVKWAWARVEIDGRGSKQHDCVEEVGQRFGGGE